MKARRKQRTKTGSLTEFGASVVILVSIIAPLLAIGFVPVRYMFCQAVISERAATLAHNEKRTDAYQQFKKETSWKATLAKVGITVSNEEMALLITSNDGGQKTLVKEGNTIPPEWLPNSPKAPFIYSLLMKAKCTLFPGVTFTVTGDSQWDNMSPDPKTMKYFVEE